MSLSAGPSPPADPAAGSTGVVRPPLIGADLSGHDTEPPRRPSRGLHAGDFTSIHRRQRMRMSSSGGTSTMVTSSPTDGDGDDVIYDDDMDGASGSRARAATPVHLATGERLPRALLGEVGGRGRGAAEESELVRTLLRGTPHSPKQLLQLIERQKDEMRLLQEENTRLRAREVEISAYGIKIQQQIAATEAQMGSLKSQIRLQLLNPISDEEYVQLEALPELKRDLLDTIKLGVYQQLGALKASKDTALSRCSELANELAETNARNRDLAQKLMETQGVLEFERQAHRRQTAEGESQHSVISELRAKATDLDAKLKSAAADQEQYLLAKMSASLKTEEVARLNVRLSEAEAETQKFKTLAECTEQKLDILKSEYYELKLRYTQRIMELESCLKAADAKLKTIGDLELETELFISNLAEGTLPAGLTAGSLALLGDSVPGSGGVDELNARSEWLAVPRSRKLAHTVTVTKRCLALENKVALLQKDLNFKDEKVKRLQASLDMARHALNNTSNPYAIVESALQKLTKTNDELQVQVAQLQEENVALANQLAQRTADVEVLCRHRQELVRIQHLLKQLGIPVDVAAEPSPSGRSSPCPPHARVAVVPGSHVEHEGVSAGMPARSIATPHSGAPDGSAGLLRSPPLESRRGGEQQGGFWRTAPVTVERPAAVAGDRQRGGAVFSPGPIEIS